MSPHMHLSRKEDHGWHEPRVEKRSFSSELLSLIAVSDISFSRTLVLLTWNVLSTVAAHAAEGEVSRVGKVH